MSFVRLYKVVQDSPVGYQTVNQLADNAEDLQTNMGVEHGETEYPGAGSKAGGGLAIPRWDALGHHNLIEIARTVSRSYLFLNNASQVPAIGSALGWTGPGIPWLLKIDVGVYFLPVLGLSSFWAVPMHFSGSGVTYLPPQVRPFTASTANGPVNGLWVSTYELAGGNFTSQDRDFSLALYGIP